MKIKFAMKGWRWLLALKVCATLCTLALVASAADSTQNPPASSDPIAQKMKAWQDKMSQIFQDTWRGLRHDEAAKNTADSSLTSASVDLREQQDAFVVRMNLPNRQLDKVDISLANDTLHVVAPADGKAGRYEQSIHLAGVTALSTIQIQRDQAESLIVVTVPKTPNLATTASTPTLTGSPMADWDAWDRDVLARMDRMQREMDRVFNQAFADFGNQPRFSGLFDQARFDSSFDVQDEGNQYVIRAYLPDRNMQNVNVSIEDRMLKIEAKGESTQQGNKGNTVFSQNAQYSQILTLPGPVQSDKMKIDRKDNMLVVTLPKVAANTTT